MSEISAGLMKQIVREICRYVIETGGEECHYNINCPDYCPFKTGSVREIVDGEWVKKENEKGCVRKARDRDSYEDIVKQACTFYVQYGGRKVDIIEYLL